MKTAKGGPPAWATKLVNPTPAPATQPLRRSNPVGRGAIQPRAKAIRNSGKPTATKPINTRILSDEITLNKTAPSKSPGTAPVRIAPADGLSQRPQ